MEWLLLLVLAGFIILQMHASNGARPTWMSCQEMRNRYGTPKRKDGRHPGGGYQPQMNDESEAKIQHPPKKL